MRRSRSASTGRSRCARTWRSKACSAPQADVNNGSFDPDGDPFTLAQAPAGPYPLGTTRVTLRAVDALGLTSSCMANVNVLDAAPPAVSGASASPASLWPPNNKMVPVTVALSATDTCSGDVTSSCRIVSISGNDSASAADWRITGPLSASLRAERSGKAKHGRTYALDVECKDASGNVARRVATVLVPHDRGRHHDHHDHDDDRRGKGKHGNQNDDDRWGND